MYRNCNYSYNNQFTNYHMNDNNYCDDSEFPPYVANTLADGCNYETNCNSEYMNTNEYCNGYNECSCGFDEENNLFPANLMYGHAYVPNQTLNKVFKPGIGLKMGTIFPELVSPYAPCQSMEINEYLKCKNEIGKGCNANEL